MPVSTPMRRLQKAWSTGTGWPKRLDWIEIDGVRGWTGQRFELRFPIMAVVGENGAGKTTVLQTAASVYSWRLDGRKREQFASDFFMDTAWDHLRGVDLRYAVREGDRPSTGSVKKPTTRWRGSPQRPERAVRWIDLSRVQPVSARVGYLKLANAAFTEASATLFEDPRLRRFSGIMGRSYDGARMAVLSEDSSRPVPVIDQQGTQYSGFHQGAGETTVAELLHIDIPRYSLVLIDELETSLHPRVQRRLMRDLADRCRELQLQVILTTHSPYVLDELPPEARAHILQSHAGERTIVYGASPEFAMTKMDDVPHYECDIFVEDERAASMLVEILAATDTSLVPRCRVIPCGAASVGQALGQMVAKNRFPTPTCVFLDGDNAPAPGCELLPGEDAPERVVFEALSTHQWANLDKRLGRPFPDVADALSSTMALADHHEWVRHAANRLTLGTEVLWAALCAEWATALLDADQGRSIVQSISDRIAGIVPEVAPPADLPVGVPPAVDKPFERRPRPKRRSATWTSETAPQLELSPDDVRE